MNYKKAYFSDNEKESFVNNLYKIMDNCGIEGQKKFAKKIGICENTLNAYLRKEIDAISFATVEKICKLGHISIDELFGKNVKEVDMEMSKLLNEIEKFSENDKEFVKKELRLMIEYTSKKTSKNES